MAQVFLTSAGWQLVQGQDETTGQRVYFDIASRPDAAAVTLPVLGDAWDQANPNVTVRQVAKAPIGEDASAGFMYVVSYSNARTQRDYLGSNADNVSVSITSSATFDAYTFQPQNGDGTPNASTLYYTADGSSFSQIRTTQTVQKMTPVTNVSCTYRYSQSISTLLSQNAGLVGKVNNATMWGVGSGCILFLGTSAVPVKAIDAGDTTIHWNVTENFSIRYLPGKTTDTWQYVFKDGIYVRLANAQTSGGITAMNPYLYATLPDPLA